METVPVIRSRSTEISWQIAVGGTLSVTVTVKEQVADNPKASVTV